MKFLRKQLSLLVIALMLVVYPSQAVFAFTELTCNLDTGEPTGGLFDPAMGSNGDCSLPTSKNLLTSLACNYIGILNDVFSKVFCSLQFGMKDIIIVSITLFITLYGLRLLIGMQEPSSAAGMLAVLKISLVVLFVMQGAMGIGLILSFFRGFMVLSVKWAVNAIQCPTIICPINPLGTDDSIAGIFSAVDAKIDRVLMGGGTGVGDGLFSDNATLVVFLLTLAVIALPVFVLAFSLVVMTIKVFASSLVTFIMSVTAVAFLVSLAPIFLCFMLFNTTYSLFDSWVRFLVSYSLQPFIIFSIFSLWMIISSDFLTFVDQLVSVMTVIPDDSKDKGSVLTVTKSLQFCHIYYGTQDTQYSIDLASPISPIQITPGGPTVSCCAIEGNPPVCTGPALTTEDPNMMPRENLVEPQLVLRNPKFIYFLAYHFISLATIGYAFLKLIKMTPQIAQSLSQSQSIAPLGKGFGHGGGLRSMIGQATSAAQAKGRKAVEGTAGKMADSINSRFAAKTGNR